MEMKEKLQLVDECRNSGMVAKEWCKQKGVPYNKYAKWATDANKLARDKSKVKWASLDFSNIPVSSGTTKEIHLEHGGWKIQIGSGSDSSLLMDILRAVNRAC